MERLKKKFKLTASNCVGLRHSKDDYARSTFSELHTGDSGIVSDTSSSTTQDQINQQRVMNHKHQSPLLPKSSLSLQGSSFLTPVSGVFSSSSSSTTSSRSLHKPSSLLTSISESSSNSYSQMIPSQIPISFSYPIDCGPVHPYMKTAPFYQPNEHPSDAYTSVASSSSSSTPSSPIDSRKSPSLSSASTDILFVPRRTRKQRRKMIRQRMLEQIHETGCYFDRNNRNNGNDGNNHQKYNNKFMIQEYHHHNNWERLPYRVLAGIIRYLSIGDIARCSLVCRNWYFIVWQPGLWKFIDFSRWKQQNQKSDINKTVHNILHLLGGQANAFCPFIQHISLDKCPEITEKSLILISNSCPNLKTISLFKCTNVSNIAIFNILSKCSSLTKLNVEGCKLISSINILPEIEINNGEFDNVLTELNLSSCYQIDDSSLCILASKFRHIRKLYLRNLSRITNVGIKYISIYLTNLRELSLNHLNRLTDEALVELCERNNYIQLEYLSLANCTNLTDRTLTSIAEHCNKSIKTITNIPYHNANNKSTNKNQTPITLYYLNLHKCSKITDNGLCLLTIGLHNSLTMKYCYYKLPPRLFSLNLSYCHLITDYALSILINYLGHYIQQLDINNCTNITGLMPTNENEVEDNQTIFINNMLPSNRNQASNVQFIHIPYLRLLNIENTLVSMVTVDITTKQLPHCHIIHNINITDC